MGKTWKDQKGKKVVKERRRPGEKGGQTNPLRDLGKEEEGG